MIKPLHITRHTTEIEPMLDNIRTFSRWAIIVSYAQKTGPDKAGVNSIQWFQLVIEDQLEKTEFNYWCGNIIEMVDCIDYDNSIFDKDEDNHKEDDTYI